jgi:hypothetical protein
VFVDGRQVAAQRSHWRVDTSGVEIPFPIGRRQCVLRTRSTGRPMEYDYQLFVDGRSVDGGSELTEVRRVEDREPPPWLRAFLPSLPVIVTVSGFLGIRRVENLPIPLAVTGLAVLGILVAVLADRLAVAVYAHEAWSRSRRNWLMAASACGLFGLYFAGLIGILSLLMR